MTDMMFYPPLGADQNGVARMRPKAPTENTTRNEVPTIVTTEGGAPLPSKRVASTSSRPVLTSPHMGMDLHTMHAQQNVQEEANIRHILRLLTAVVFIIMCLGCLLYFFGPHDSIWERHHKNAVH